MPLGILLSVAARAGKEPRRTAQELVRGLLFLLIGMGICAFVAGSLGGRISAFYAALFAHNASYASGIVGGLLFCLRVLYGRWRETR